MANYERLKKIIPPDQALANEALSRGLLQVKQIFNADLPTVAQVASNLETNKGLDQIEALTTPLPTEIANYYGNTLATGTGPGNTITINDMIGTASGNTTVAVLPVQTSVLEQLDTLGALDPLMANTGNPSGSNNGIYTAMTYCLGGAYTSDDGMGTYTVTIPFNDYIPGTPISFISGNTPDPAIDQAFSTTLIPSANSWIANIAANNASLAQQSNDAGNAICQQMVINVNNLTAAEIDIGNLVLDPSNANLIANSVSSALTLTTQLHEIGLDVTQGGAAQFFDAVANTASIAGQAVVASMREGRNIVLLQNAGIAVDTQVSDINANLQIANNLSNGQFSVSEARANIVL